MKFLSQINVNTEYTLPIVDGTNGQVLATDGNGNAYWGSISAGSTNLDALTDVILTSPSSGQLLRYGIPPGSGETQPVWYNFTPNYLTPSSSIDNLGDVTITSATSGQILQWNGSAWVNATLSTVEYVSKVQHLVKAGVAITKGQAVYVTSADGTNMIVGLASNASEATSSKVIGLAASNAAINGQIFVVTEGLLAGLDTSTATAGDPVWLGANGNLIFGLLNKPTSPAHLVYIGVVTRVQQNNGEIFVKVQNGIEIDEIHDVQISSPATGQLLRRDSDGYWKNWTPNFLTSFTETDPTVPSHVKSISTTDINNWNTGYNDSIRAIGFSTTTGVVTLTQQDGGTLTVDLDGRYLQSFTETDPIFTGSTAYNISNQDVLNWDTAYGWGDHSTFGYITTESDPTVPAHVKSITTTEKSNWTAAYDDKINTASFNTANGVLTLTQQDGGTVTVDLDGRYLTSDTDAQTLAWEAPTKNLSITNGNTITLEGLATEDYVLSQGFISSESDTLATVTARGNISNTKIQIRTAGNAAGGNIQLGPYSDGASKWAYITAQHYNSSLEPEGFTLIGGLAQNGQNAVVIGGNIYESNPATQIQFWTHSSDTHGFGGTQRGVIDSSGNWGVGTTNPQYRLDVAGGNVRLSQGYESVRIHGVDLLGYSSGNLWQIGNTTYSSLVLSTSWDWDRQVEFNYTPNTTGQASGVLRIGQLQKNSATWTHGRTDFYVNGSIRSNINTYGVGIGREAASNEKLAVDISDGVWGVHIYNAGTAIGGLHANSSVITLQSDGNRNIEIATGTGNANWNGNIIATRAWVQAQGYITGYTETDTLATVTARGSSTTSSITVNGYLTVAGGADLYLKAGTGSSDSGDIVFQDGTGAELHRLWSGTNTLNYRTNAGTTYQMIHTGNIGSQSVNYATSAGDSTNLGGLSSARYVKQDYYNTGYNWDTIGAASTDTAIVLRVESSASNPPAGDVYNWSLWQQGTKLRGSQIAVSAYGEPRMFFRGADGDNNVYAAWNEIIHSGNIASQTIGYASQALQVIGQSGQNYSSDNRTISPSEISPGYLQFGFTSWGNNSTSPWADYLHMRSYTDSSGGSDNLVMFKKSGIGMRIWQQTFGSSTAYSSYADVWTTENFSSINVTNWNTAYGWGNHADAPYWNVSLNQNIQVESQQVTFAGDVVIQGTLTESSSIRFKENITPLDQALDKVNQLEAVSYNKIGVDDREIGLIAEDVAELFPEVVTYNEEGQPQGIQYQRLSVILLKAVQELTERVNKLENK